MMNSLRSLATSLSILILTAALLQLTSRLTKVEEAQEKTEAQVKVQKQRADEIEQFVGLKR